MYSDRYKMMNSTLIIEDNTVYEIDPNCKIVMRNGREKTVVMKAAELKKKKLFFLIVWLIFSF